MDKVRSVHDLEVFKLAHGLALEIYSHTKKFPKVEIYSLSSQMQRAAISIGANLSEGANKGSRAEFRRYVNNAKGSTGELIYHLLVAKDLKYLPDDDYQRLSGEYRKVIKMLERLSQSLKRVSGDERNKG